MNLVVLDVFLDDEIMYLLYVSGNGDPVRSISTNPPISARKACLHGLAAMTGSTYSLVLHKCRLLIQLCNRTLIYAHMTGLQGVRTTALLEAKLDILFLDYDEHALESSNAPHSHVSLQSITMSNIALVLTAL